MSKKVDFSKEDYQSKKQKSDFEKQFERKSQELSDLGGNNPNMVLELISSNKKILLLVLMLIFFVVTGIGRCILEIYNLNWYYITALLIWLSIIPIKSFISWLKNRKK